MSDDQTENLEAFGIEFQKAILGYCLTEYSFLSSCRRHVPYQWFTNALLSELVKITYEIFDEKHNSNVLAEKKPSRAEVATKIVVLYPKLNEQQERLNLLQVCCLMAESRTIGLEWMTRQMTGWVRMCRLKNMLVDAGQKFKRKQYDDCIDWVDQKIFDVRSVSFMEEMGENFDNPVDFLLTYAADLEANCCTLGHPDLDNILRQGSKMTDFAPGEVRIEKLTRGCLMPGDLTVLMGATNAGKTTAIITIAAYNILMGKHVLMFTHEQYASQIKLKILAALMRMQLGDLINKVPKSPELSAILIKASEILSTRLKYIHYVKPGKMFIEDVCAVIDQEQEKRFISRSTNPQAELRVERGFDLVIDDYPAKLKSRYLGNKAGIWEERAYCYNELLNQADAYKFHVLAPVQTNRTGVKVNRGETADKRMLQVDDVAEGFGIMTIAANVLTINRSDVDKANSLIKLHVAKSRSSMTGQTFIIKSEFEQSRAFSSNEKALIVPPGAAVDEAMLMKEFGLASAAQHQQQTERQNKINDILKQAPAQPVTKTAEQLLAGIQVEVSDDAECDNDEV